MADFLKNAGLDQEIGFSPDHIKDLGDGTYVMAKRLLFHWMLIRGDIGDLLGYFNRWCYDTQENVLRAVQDFPLHPDSSYEPTGWHRHPRTHRRRPDGDPSREYIDA